jgi:hypothetical protein
MYPAARNPTTGKDEGVVAVFVDDGELKIAVERRGRYGLPHEALCASRIGCRMRLYAPRQRLAI